MLLRPLGQSPGCWRPRLSLLVHASVYPPRREHMYLLFCHSSSCAQGSHGENANLKIEVHDVQELVQKQHALPLNKDQVFSDAFGVFADQRIL